MESEHYDLTLEDNQDNNLKDMLLKYLTHWKWFLLSIVVALTGGYCYLRMQTPLYEVNASILIKNEKKDGDLTELSAFADLELLKGNSNIDNEIEILRSRSLMLRTVEELNLHINYFLKERPRESELFSNSPLVLTYVVSDSTKQDVWGQWTIVPKSKTHFTLQQAGNDQKTEYQFGSAIATDFGYIRVKPSSHFNEWYVGKELIARVNSKTETAEQYRNSIQIYPSNKNSSVLILSLQDPLIDKAKLILNNLIKQHNLDAIHDKNEVSKNTADFINERINYITTELSDVEGAAESFKKAHKLTDVKSEAELFLKTGSESELSLLETGTQLKLAEYMYDDLNKRNSTTDLIPSNLGLQDLTVAAMISDYNKLVLERNRMLKNAGEKNPAIENIDTQLTGLKRSLKESLTNLMAALLIRQKELSKQEGGISSKIAEVPRYEREYRSIQRQQQIKEALYLYLLQKREETNIALAVTVANAKIIDQAYSNGARVAPKKNIIYLASLLIGLLLPIAVLFIRDLLDTKVHGKNDIDKVRLPYLGDIPQSDTKDHLVVSANNKSNMAEAFRLLRTNVEFLTSNRKGSNRTVFVTSTVGKEGKSYIALNLAASFALSGKKTLLVGTDVRVPKILAYLGLEEKRGLTDFIMDKSINADDIVFRMNDYPDFSVLPSGQIPPNPAELLMHPRVKELFEMVKEKYDYVIVDTAPVGLVTDTLLLAEYADCTVYVARANVLDKRMLRIPESLNKERRLPNLAVLINGAGTRQGYGYSYGYGYGLEKTKKWWHKMPVLNRFA